MFAIVQAIGWPIWPLIFASVIALALIIERSAALRRSRVLPANLLQAQRDYFGAHTYERLDQPRGQFFHTNWTGKGGDVASGSYTA